MVYILSFLGILLEVSLPFGANIYIITLPFYIYLIMLKDKVSIFTYLLIVLLISLQTDNLFRNILVFIFGYYIINWIFIHFEYRKGNIILITLAQSILYIILSSFNLRYLIINIIGFIILNYIYIKIYKRGLTRR